MDRAHSHPDIEINVLHRGELEYFLEGRRVRVRSGRPILFWGGLPHQTLFGKDAPEGIWITLPLGWLLQWRLAGRLREALIAGRIVEAPPDPSGHAPPFKQWLTDYQSGLHDRRCLVAAELECWFTRLALDHEPKQLTPAPLPPNDGGEKVEAVTRFLGKHYLEELQVSDIARAVGWHPKYLLTAFRRQTRMTVWTYLSRLRLAHAQRLLLTTDRTILDIAHASGFGSSAAFYRTFGKAFPNQSPSGLRRAGATSINGSNS